MPDPNQSPYSPTYRFAYRFLPSNFYAGAIQALLVWAQPGAMRQAWHAWTSIVKTLSPQSRREDFPREIAATPLKAGEGVGLLIRYPKPPNPALGEPPEPWFTAAVLLDGKPRYYTLEAMARDIQRITTADIPTERLAEMQKRGLFGTTMLGEILPDGSRRSWLLGCEPTPEAFALLLTQHFEREKRLGPDMSPRQIEYMRDIGL